MPEPGSEGQQRSCPGKACPRCKRVEPPTEDWTWHWWYGSVDVCENCATELADEETEEWLEGTKTEFGYDCTDYLGWED